MSSKNVLSENSIGQLFRDLACESGLKDGKKITNGTLRSFGITKLANNPNVNTADVARAARHRSLSTQQHYIN